jgi:hypothetical protein
MLGGKGAARPAGQAVEAGDEFFGPALSQLDRVKIALSRLGIRYRELQGCPLGVGVSVIWTESGYLVLSVAGAVDSLLNITAGLLKDVRPDRSQILELCNTMTRDNAALPVYLHDASGAWDINVQQRFQIDLLLTETRFFRSCLESLAVAAMKMRSKFHESGIEGRPYSLSGEDAQRLLLRSLAWGEATPAPCRERS